MRSSSWRNLSTENCRNKDSTDILDCLHRRCFRRDRHAAERIAERPAEAIEADLHRVAVFETNARAETERVGAEEVDMEIAGVAMEVELEMVVFDVGEAVAHVGLAGLDRARPDGLTIAFDRDFARNQMEVRIDHQLRADGTGSQF